MNTRTRTVNSIKTAQKIDKAKEKEKENKSDIFRARPKMDPKKARNRYVSRRERKIALQQDVDKLKKKLRHEENVHRALERAFTRPLGALPRLPPYLPSHTLELLAEVAVLEEEVVRLEEQVVNFRQGLYQEAIYISASKKTAELSLDMDQTSLQSSKNSGSPAKASTFSSESSNGTNPTNSVCWCSEASPSDPSSNRSVSHGKRPSKGTTLEDRRGKENQLNVNSARNNCKQSPLKRGLQTKDAERTEQKSHGPNLPPDEPDCTNKVSEDLLQCLMSIFLQMGTRQSTKTEEEMSPSISGSTESSDGTHFLDPYGVCSEFGRRDIGPYKLLHVVDGSSININLLASSSSFLHKQLKTLLHKLAKVELSRLSQQQKLAFWINIYNSCIMNAFIEKGIPSSPDMVVALMTKAMINVGGHLLSAMTIEHFILRLPYISKHINPKGAKINEIINRGVLGLEWPEPLVTFALSCGSWSSPAVRVYTASQVEKELDEAKRDYLQAAIGISTSNKLAIPKLLDWYLLDFAKDVESLMDWICLQLPAELRTEAVKCVEMGRKHPVTLPIQVLPYDFTFRYLLPSQK